MFNAKMLLDALVSASARPGGLGGALGDVINQAAGGLQDATQKASQAPSIGQKVDQTIGQVASGVASGQGPGDLMKAAKSVMANNPGLAEAAMIGLAGLLLGPRRSRGVQPSLVQLGGLALVGGLAYKAFQNYQAGRPALELGAGQGGQAGAQGAVSQGGQAGGQGAGASQGGQSGTGGGSAAAPASGGAQRASGGSGGAGGSSSGGQSSGGMGGSSSGGQSSSGAGGASAGGRSSGGMGAGASAGSTQGSGATAAGGQGSSEMATSLRTLGMPENSHFHPVSQTEDDTLLYLRTMVAAASADGQIDENERKRIVQGLTQAGIDVEATRWLEREMAAPADVEELASGVTSREKAAQIYTAARIAIDPDTIQEREFLRQLCEALDLDQDLKTQIDSTAAAIKAA